MTIVDNGVAVGSRDSAVAIRNPLPTVLQDTASDRRAGRTPDALVSIVEDDLYFVFLSSETYTAQENAREAFVTVIRSGLPSFMASR